MKKCLFVAGSVLSPIDGIAMLWGPNLGLI